MYIVTSGSRPMGASRRVRCLTLARERAFSLSLQNQCASTIWLQIRGSDPVRVEIVEFPQAHPANDDGPWPPSAPAAASA